LAAALRKKYVARLESGELQSGDARAVPQASMSALQRRIVDAQRQSLMELRARGVIGDAAFQAAEAELDLLELSSDPRLYPAAVPHADAP
jgi:CPA1 family monovalent cation:H+ antiporter